MHVDDILLIGNDTNELNKFISYLETNLTKVKCNRDAGEFTYLGINIKRDRNNRLIRLSQRTYIDKILSTYLPDDEEESLYPIDCENILRENQGEGHALAPIYDIIGSLRFIVDRTRSDLLYPVHFLSRYMNTPSRAVYFEVRRLLRYLRNTKEYEFLLGGKQLLLFAMCDASFIDTGDCKSQVGYAIFLSYLSGAISTYSKKSSSVALSSTHSETDGLVECIKELHWAYGFLCSIGVQISKPILVLVDNKPLITLSKDGNHLRNSKHFIIKSAYIREEVKDGFIYIQHVKGINNHADILTKALMGYLLFVHTAAILGHFIMHNILRELEQFMANQDNAEDFEIISEDNNT
jgi:hypothetical protein